MNRKSINWALGTITIEQYEEMEKAGEMDHYPLTENGIPGYHVHRHGVTGQGSLIRDQRRLLGNPF